MNAPRSLFAFAFRLSPWETCLGLHFHRQQLADEYHAVCTRDQRKVFWVGDPAHNDQARATANTLAQHLVHANTYLAYPVHTVADVEPVSWLEVSGVQSTTVTAGYMSPTLEVAPLRASDPDGDRFKAAAELVRKIGRHPSMSLSIYMALADFHTAKNETSPYAAFFGFRVLEDVGYAFGTVTDDKPNWPAMNAALGTSEQDWTSLTKAGTWARHLSETKLSVQAPLSKVDALKIAQRSLSLLLRHAGIQ